MLDFPSNKSSKHGIADMVPKGSTIFSIFLAYQILAFKASIEVSVMHVDLKEWLFT